MAVQTTELLDATKAALAQERTVRMERKWANLRQLEMAIASSQPAANTAQPAESEGAEGGGAGDTEEHKATEAAQKTDAAEMEEDKVEGGLTDSDSD
jgi:hypothetical protein